jgi:hypothetical protein
MKLGSGDISKLMLGSTEIEKVYLGSNEIYASASGIGPGLIEDFESTTTDTNGNSVPDGGTLTWLAIPSYNDSYSRTTNHVTQGTYGGSGFTGLSGTGIVAGPYVFSGVSSFSLDVVTNGSLDYAQLNIYNTGNTNTVTATHNSSTPSTITATPAGGFDWSDVYISITGYWEFDGATDAADMDFDNLVANA